MSTSASFISNLPFRVGEGDDLVLLASKSADRSCLALSPVQLTEGLWFLGRPGEFRFPTHWRSYMGSMVADSIEASPFCLAAHGRHTDDPGGTIRKLETIYFCVQLHGLPGIGRYWIAPTRCVEGCLQPQELRDGAYLRLPDTEGFPITTEVLTSAAAMLQNALSVSGTEGRFERLRRGVSALSHGMKEKWPDRRLHYYVRALEAVAVPRPNHTGSDFRKRAALFAASSEEATTTLKDMYELRCNVEHLHGWMSPRKKWEIDERGARLRLWQAENLAFHVYRRILHDSKLLAHFETDENCKRFWGKNETDRKEAWGEPLDLARYVWKTQDRFGVRDYSPLATFPGGVPEGEKGDLPPWPENG